MLAERNSYLSSCVYACSGKETSDGVAHAETITGVEWIGTSSATNVKLRRSVFANTAKLKLKGPWFEAKCRVCMHVHE